VCLSVTSRSINTAKRIITPTTPYDNLETMRFSDAKGVGKIPMDSPSTGEQNTRGYD